MNRSYYAAFTAARAVLALQRLDFASHKAVLNRFRQDYIKTGLVSSQISQDLKTLQNYRHDSDYDDWFDGGRKETQESVDAATRVLHQVYALLEKQGYHVAKLEEPT